MNALNADNTVSEWVLDRPARTRVFERLRIDYCCGGKRRLADVCSEKGLDPQALVRELREVSGGPVTAGHDRDWAQESATALCDHIQTTHHAWLWQELPRLAGLAERVAQAHVARHPETRQVQSVLAGLRAELESHMLKEERVLFPLIRTLDGGRSPGSACCATIQAPIRQMEIEHDDAGRALAQLHGLTGGYQVPPDACNTYRALLDGLRELELDMHLHVHEENHILFPRALELERAVAGGATCDRRRH